jgi:hypothetical protein
VPDVIIIIIIDDGISQSHCHFLPSVLKLFLDDVAGASSATVMSR